VQFANRGEDFEIHGLIFSYLIKPDLLDTATTQLDLDLLGGWIIMLLKCSTLNLRHQNKLNGHQYLPNCGKFSKETAWKRQLLI